MSTDDTIAARRGSDSNDLLGPVAYRVKLATSESGMAHAYAESERLRAYLQEPVKPLYDQAALDAAVAAERERCANLCEALAATGPLDEERALHAAARRIRGPNAKLTGTQREDHT